MTLSNGDAVLHFIVQESTRTQEFTFNEAEAYEEVLNLKSSVALNPGVRYKVYVKKELEKLLPFNKMDYDIIDLGRNKIYHLTPHGSETIKNITSDPNSEENQNTQRSVHVQRRSARLESRGARNGRSIEREHMRSLRDVSSCARVYRRHLFRVTPYELRKRRRSVPYNATTDATSGINNPQENMDTTEDVDTSVDSSDITAVCEFPDVLSGKKRSLEDGVQFDVPFALENTYGNLSVQGLRFSETPVRSSPGRVEQPLPNPRTPTLSQDARSNEGGNASLGYSSSHINGTPSPSTTDRASTPFLPSSPPPPDQSHIDEDRDVQLLIGQWSMQSFRLVEARRNFKRGLIKALEIENARSNVMDECKMISLEFLPPSIRKNMVNSH